MPSFGLADRAGGPAFLLASAGRAVREDCPPDDCGCGGDCTLWQRMRRCDDAGEVRWVCHDPRSLCSDGTNATGGAKTLAWDGFCWTLENAFDADPPDALRVPPGIVFECFTDCARCNDCDDCCDRGPCGWRVAGANRRLTVSGSAAATVRNTVLCLVEGCQTRESSVGSDNPDDVTVAGCTACNVSASTGGEPRDGGAHYQCDGPDGPNVHEHASFYQVRLNTPDTLDFTGFSARDGAAQIEAPYAFVRADLRAGYAIGGGVMEAYLLAAVNLETGAWAAALDIRGVVNLGPLDAAFTVSGGSGCTSADLEASVTFAAESAEGIDCAPDVPDRFTGTLSVSGRASAIEPCGESDGGRGCGCDEEPPGGPSSPSPFPRPTDPRIDAHHAHDPLRGCRGCGDGFAG